MLAGSYTPSSATSGAGQVMIGETPINFNGLEPVTISGMSQFTFVTPSSQDVLTIDSPLAGQNRIAGTSGRFPFESLTFFDVADFTIDTATNDAATPDDAIAISSVGLVATGLRVFTIRSGAGADSLHVSSMNYGLPVAGGALTFDGAAGDDLLVAVADVHFTLSDSMLASSAGGAIALVGVDRASLTGGPSPNTFVVSGFTGTAMLDGGNDADLVVAASGAGFSLGDDLLSVDGSGRFTLVRVEQASLTSGAADDRINAADFSGRTTLSGGGGRDTLVGGSGNDVLIGGPGADLLGGGLGSDRVVDAGDVDFVLTADSLVRLLAGVELERDTLDGIESASLTGGDGNNRLDASAFSLGSVSLIGGTGDDVLLGGSAARVDPQTGELIGDLLVGDNFDGSGAGNDTVTGGRGNDTIDGGAGDDVQTEAGGLAALDTDDRVNVEAVFLFGTDGPDLLDVLAQQLAGFNGRVLFDGLGGDDTLAGGNQNDTFVGGAGNDVFRFRDGWGVDEVREDSGGGQDTIDFSAVTTKLKITLGSVQAEDSAGNIATHADGNVETVIAGSDDDEVPCLGSAGKLTVLLGPGDDMVECSAASVDLNFDGGTGNDTIRGGRGNDVLAGGAGFDVLVGNDGDDVLVAGDDDDMLDGGAGNDSLTGGTGDQLNGGLGCDTVNGAEDPPPCGPLSQPTVEFAAANTPVAEKARTATITVSLSMALTTPASVKYATNTGTASAADYTGRTGTLTFAPGQTTRTFTIKVRNDKQDEADKTVNLALSNPTGSVALGAMTAAALTIMDDDPTPSLRFTRTTGNAREQAGTFTLSVSLSAASGRPVTVDYATAGGTATPGGDFTARTGTLSFAPGQRSLSISVPITNDTGDEPNETFLVQLSNPSGATLAAGTATVTIIDNDPPGALAAFGVRLAHALELGNVHRWSRTEILDYLLDIDELAGRFRSPR